MYHVSSRLWGPGTVPTYLLIDMIDCLSDVMVIRTQKERRIDVHTGSLSYRAVRVHDPGIAPIEPALSTRELFQRELIAPSLSSVP